MNALELTLTDGTTLTYPYTLSPVVTFNDYDVAVSFDTGKTSLVNKTDITGYNQVWSHNKNLFPQMMTKLIATNVITKVAVISMTTCL